MLRQIAVGVAQAAEVDDALDARLTRSRAEIERRLLITLVESLAGAHAVDQVVGGTDTLQCGPQRVRPEHVGLDHIDPIEPRPLAQPAGVARHHPHRVTGSEQRRNESSADVSGCASDQDWLGEGHAGGLAGAAGAGVGRTRRAIQMPRPNSPARMSTSRYSMIGMRTISLSLSQPRSL